MININIFFYDLFKKYKFIIFAVILLSIIIISYFLIKEEEINYDFELNYLDETNIRPTNKVEIKGAVNNPGVYSFDDGERITDVIIKAGGIKEDADTSNINLSKLLSDEMVVIIPTIAQKTIYTTNNSCYYTVITNDGEIESSDNSNSTSDIVNINTASASELMTLSGIGEKKALAIISYREENGLFSSIEEITNVSGIGSSTFESIKDQITI
ncbi:MAG: helix-hairpin-helix domain-containing protein [Bacilli bacterium]|nr:helix-hairpin-helix domain-containing protein [Bacilli bacterium]